LDATNNESNRLIHSEANTQLKWAEGALAAGLACYRRAEYFQAHEHWEEVWRPTVDVQRHFLQTLVQLAVALCHHQRGNRRGALGQMRKSLAHLQHCPQGYGGVDGAALRLQMELWVDWLALEPTVAQKVAAPARPAITDQ